jgi:glucose-1-phosphate adenylyltransferase
MYKKKECIAMLLAGGQGSRLFTLTEKTAKPAIPFGGKYRIIDFTLSNCINSGIDTVGVLTQYQPLVLNEYIGNGQPWDLDRTFGGVMVLPPYQKSKSADWYKGTANAIYQNLNFIERYDPDYVVILSGDHIYKMDYSAMLDYHKEMNADCTIAVLDVPLDQASRFGIMNCHDDGKIYEFEEKPANPKSTKASMGIYIFNKSTLAKYLIEDEANPDSSNDFGKNIIPAMLGDGCTLYAYEFSGYWKDVGTIPSLWEAHMDLLGEEPVFNLYDSTRRVLSRSESRPPHFIGDDAKIANSMITEGCEVHGTVINSVLFGGVYVAPGAVIKDSIIMSDSKVLEGAEVCYSIIDSDTVIGNDVKLGVGQKPGKFKITLIGGGLSIGTDDEIPAGSMVNEAFLAKRK